MLKYNKIALTALLSISLLNIDKVSAEEVEKNEEPMVKVTESNIDEVKESYNILDDITKSYKDDIVETSTKLEDINKAINEKKNQLILKEKDFDKLDNELAIKKEQIKVNMERLLVEIEKFNITLLSYQKNHNGSSLIMQYLSYIFEEESLIEGLEKVYVYKTLADSVQEQIALLNTEYENLKKESIELQDTYFDLMKQRGKLTFDKRDLETQEKLLNERISMLEEKERIRIEIVLIEEEKNRQIALTKALLDEKFRLLSLSSEDLEYDETKGTLLGHPMFLKIDTENPKYFIVPTDGRFTSGFGWRDIGDGPEFHNGIDIANPVGTPIYASATGIVTYVGPMGNYGNLVKVKHEIKGTTYTTVYAHLNNFAVSVGDNVKQGEIIALMGNTGRSTGPHLHFEVQLGTGHHTDNPLNPSDWLNKPLPVEKKDVETDESKEIKKTKDTKKDNN